MAIIAFGTFLATFAGTAFVALRDEPLVITPLIEGTRLTYVSILFLIGASFSGFAGGIYIAYKASSLKIVKAIVGGIIVCFILKMSISLIQVIIPMSLIGGLVGAKKSNKNSNKSDGYAAD